MNVFGQCLLCENKRNPVCKEAIKFEGGKIICRECIVFLARALQAIGGLPL